MHKTQVVAEHPGEQLGLRYAEKNVAPSVLDATGLVGDRRAAAAGRLDRQGVGKESGGGNVDGPGLHMVVR